MKQVDFYLISNQVVDAKYKLASRLASKLQRLQQSALLITDSADATAELDRVMWSFSDTSFLAHKQLGETDKTSKIAIGGQNLVSPEVLENDYEVLINLSSKVPVFSHNISRIAEIVEASDESKALARQRYKHYQTEGFELKTHKIEL